MPTTNLNLPLIVQNQAQKEVTVNEAISRIDAILNRGAITKTLNTPPLSPSEGDLYLINSAPTDAWATHAGKIAYFQAGWKFIAPNEGMTLWVNDENLFYIYDGASWVSLFASINGVGMLGVNSTADAINRLSVSSDAVLFDAETNDIRIKVNKTAVADTASYLFQTNFSGRAEFGLIGDDDFSLKVSDDGSNFTSVFRVDTSLALVDYLDNPLIRPVLKDYAFAVASNAASGAAASIDLEKGNWHELTLTGNCTLTLANPPAAGGQVRLVVHQDATGSRTLTWPASVKWAGGSAPAVSSAALAIDIFTLITTDGGVTWYGIRDGASMG